jgi:hypothetical protein
MLSEQAYYEYLDINPAHYYGCIINPLDMLAIYIADIRDIRDGILDILPATTKKVHIIHNSKNSPTQTLTYLRHTFNNLATHLSSIKLDTCDTTTLYFINMPYNILKIECANARSSMCVKFSGILDCADSISRSLQMPCINYLNICNIDIGYCRTQAMDILYPSRKCKSIPKLSLNRSYLSYKCLMVYMDYLQVPNGGVSYFCNMIDNLPVFNIYTLLTELRNNKYCNGTIMAHISKCMDLMLQYARTNLNRNYTSLLQ